MTGLLTIILILSMSVTTFAADLPGSQETDVVENPGSSAPEEISGSTGQEDQTSEKDTSEDQESQQSNEGEQEAEETKNDVGGGYNSIR